MKYALTVGIIVFIVWVLSGIVFSHSENHREKIQSIESKLLIEIALMYLEDKKGELESELEEWQSGDYVWITSENRQMSDDGIRERKNNIQIEITKVKRLINNLLEMQEEYQ